ncbi:M48 family metalloprotease [Longispora sp. NPDC051575]|uniref:M48 family metallopeptidase n=1 Tax=Longispora sp. NPDC051575 TaxID=3154943 RepID=UPI0034275377
MIALLMLIGIYVLSLAIVAGAGYAGYAVWTHSSHGAAAGKVSLLLAGIGVTVLIGMWKALAPRPSVPHGHPVTEADAPELWAQVRALAAEVRTRAPDEIRMIGDVNAAVSEDARFLGLKAGRRTLYVGAPLLLTLTADQFRSVLAHELGHYSGSDTRLSGLTYLGRETLIQIGSRFGRWNPINWLLRGYFRLYLLVTHAISRRQELLADEFSARVAGRDTAIAALRELPVADAAFDTYLRHYVSWAADHGYAPTDVMGGFREFLAARPDQLAKVRAEPAPEKHSRWDSHPPIAERVRLLSAFGSAHRVADTRPATALLRDPGALMLAAERTAFDFGTRQVLSWSELIPAAAVASSQHVVDRLYRAAARVAGTGPGGLGLVFDLLAAGRAPELATRLRTDTDDLGEYVTAAIRATAVASGAASWELNWAGPFRLRGADGELFALGFLVTEAVTDPASVPALRARLAERGIDVAAGVQASARADARTAEPLFGIANVKLGEAEHDLIVTDEGLIFASSGKSDEGTARMSELLAAGPVAELAARSRWLPFEEIASTRVMKESPVQVELTLHGGGTLLVKETWGSEYLGKKVQRNFRELMESLND